MKADWYGCSLNNGNTDSDQGKNYLRGLQCFSNYKSWYMFLRWFINAYIVICFTCTFFRVPYWCSRCTVGARSPMCDYRWKFEYYKNFFLVDNFNYFVQPSKNSIFCEYNISVITLYLYYIKQCWQIESSYWGFP